MPSDRSEINLRDAFDLAHEMLHVGGDMINRWLNEESGKEIAIKVTAATDMILSTIESSHLSRRESLMGLVFALATHAKDMELFQKGEHPSQQEEKQSAFDMTN